MFYFIILDAIAFFNLLMFSACLIFLISYYWLSIKQPLCLVRKSTLIINVIGLIILLFFTIFSFLVNYEFEALFHQPIDKISSIVISVVINVIYLLLTLMMSFYLIVGSSRFLIYPETELIPNQLQTFETKRYRVEPDQVIKLKNQKVLPKSKWIIIKKG